MGDPPRLSSIRELRQGHPSLTLSLVFESMRRAANIAVFGVVLVSSALLISCSQEGLDPHSAEASAARSLRMQRYSWMQDGCPQPPRAEKYTLSTAHTTNYTYSGTLVISNKTYHGLFAEKYDWVRDTILITTAGDILSLGPSGEVKLLEQGRPW